MRINDENSIECYCHKFFKNSSPILLPKILELNCKKYINQLQKIHQSMPEFQLPSSDQNFHSRERNLILDSLSNHNKQI
jgi:hypothetical protein